MKTISLVLPAYNEEACIEALYSELKEVLGAQTQYSFELLFVNDGSTDSTEKLITNIIGKDDRVQLISFSRNFGHEVAITAGLDYARGDAVIVMDTDLQDPPQVIPRLIHEWEQGQDVVFATRQSRKKDTWMKRSSALLFYRFLSKVSEIPIPSNTGDFRLLDKKVVEVMRKFGEHSRFMRGISAYVGFKQKQIFFDREKRFGGETKYSFFKLLRLSMDIVTGFSTVPLRFISGVGFFVSLLSFLGVIYAIVSKFILGVAIPGWTSIAIPIFFIGGIQMIMLGIIGSYIARIYDDVRDRPLYIVAKHIKK